jgi:hypothetical protein
MRRASGYDGSMAEEKKRFPWWWLTVCAALLVPLAATLCFIETVGRRGGTLVGKYERVEARMSRDETHRILGPPDYSTSIIDRWHEPETGTSVQLTFQDNRVSEFCFVSDSGGTHNAWWRLCRWAELAWDAIHGTGPKMTVTP